MKRFFPVSIVPILFGAGCATSQSREADTHSEHVTVSSVAAKQVDSLPADEAGALPRLKSSPRHGEWLMVRAGAQDSVRVWIVYPQRKSNAPVVVVVHEIYGLTPWVRAVADQLAAEGFLAIAPDLLTTKNIPGFPDSIDRSAAIAAMGTLQSADVQRQLNAVADFALSLPGTTKKYGIIGFCRGGDISFQHALFSSRLSASVVFYGRAPANASFKSISAPILGLYGGSDTRVDATILPTDSAMKQAGKIYEYHIYDGAGHGFLRQQTGMDGANAAATARSWPEAIAWFHKYLGS